jgi:hypothetical protein
LKEQLQYYNLVQNKHIPNDFLINSRDVRLKLLAGLIDTDGCVQNKGRRIEIIQCIPNLSKQIQFLSRSLGFSVSITTRTRKNVVCPNTDAKDYKDQQHINISGKLLDEIPTLLPRKKCVRQVGGVDLLRTGIEVVSQNTGNYYGWRVDGNKRFLLGDFTIGHNCDQMWCVSCHTAFSWKDGKIETGVVHNPHFYQFQRNNGNGNAPRVRGDVRCGGLVGFYAVNDKIEYAGFSSEMKWVSEAHRLVGHIRGVELPIYRPPQVAECNRDLRILFLLNEIKEKDWQSKLKAREKKREKNNAIFLILSMFADSLSDLMGVIADSPTDDIPELLVQLNQLREYVDNTLVSVGERFKNKTPRISPQWQYTGVGRKRY